MVASKHQGMTYVDVMRRYRPIEIRNMLGFLQIEQELDRQETEETERGDGAMPRAPGRNMVRYRG